MDGYKRYIKTKVVGTDTLVVDGYSDWQTDKFDPVDMQLSGTYTRQFDTPLLNDRMQFIYKLVNGSMVARSQAELDAEYNARPTPPPNQDDRIKSLEDALLSLLLGGM